MKITNRLHGLSEEEVKSLSTSELDAHSSNVMEKMRGLLLRKCVFELTTPQCHGGIFQHFSVFIFSDQKINLIENQFDQFGEYLKEYLGVTIKRVLFPGMGSVQARVETNRHRRLIIYQNPARKRHRRQNMDEGRHGSRETIM